MPSRPRPGSRNALRFELFGGFRLLIDGTLVDRGLTPRQQHVVAFLLLHPNVPVSRAQIAGQLWPDSADAQALTNLRRELHHVRRALPEIGRALDAGPRAIVFSPTAGIHLDVAEFDAASNRGANPGKESLERAADLYQGDLLPELDAAWIAPLRDRFRRHAIEILASLVDWHERERDWARMIERAEALLRIDPGHEPTWRALMRGHARRGDRASGLHVFQRCAAVLEHELAVQPSAATRMAYRELLDLEEAAAAVKPAIAGATVYPLVGRAQPWALLLQAWNAAALGRAQLVVIRGEAGIGKTRLAEELIDWARAAGHRVAVARCFAGEGQLAYAPVAGWLQSEAISTALAALDPAWRREVARVAPAAAPELDGGAFDFGPLESWQRPRFFEGLARAFMAAAPVLLVVDDLQWCDRDTLEWLHFLLRFAPASPCLLVGTVRSEEEADTHGLELLLDGLQRLERLATINLERLDEAATARLAESVAGHPLDASTRARVFQRTEGNPLFVVETGRMTGAADAGDANVVLPTRVQGAVAHRLALLSPAARSCAELAAAIGRDFSLEVLAEASDLEELTLVNALDELWQRHVVRAHDHHLWDFSHDRIREVTYASIGPARRLFLHRRIAEGLERLHASDLDSVSAAIAGHLEQAERADRAVEYLVRAARTAIRVSANEEAIRALTRALALLDRCPGGVDRDRQEIAIRTILSGAIVAARGYAAREAELNHERLVALSVGVDGADSVIEYLCGLWAVRFVRGDMRHTREVLDRMRQLPPPGPERAWYFHHACAVQHLSGGEFEPARRHFDACLAAAPTATSAVSMLGSEFGVFSRAWSAHVLWLLGRAEDGRGRAKEAIQRAERLNHPYSQTLAHAYAAMLYVFCGECDQVAALAASTSARCERFGFAYYGEWAAVLQGWVRARNGDPAGAIEQIRSGLRGFDRQEVAARRPFYLSLLAEAYLAAGDRAQAAATLDDALAIAAAHEEEWWSAELHRRRGELEDGTAAEPWFRRALAIARTQGSPPLQLRAALSLTRVRRHLDATTDVDALLAPILRAFPQPAGYHEVHSAQEMLAAR